MKLKLHWQILIAILSAVAAGWLSGPGGAVFGILLVDVYDFIGIVFGIFEHIAYKVRQILFDFFVYRFFSLQGQHSPGVRS